MKKLLSIAAILLSLNAYSGQQTLPENTPVKVESRVDNVAITDNLPADAIATYPTRGKAIARTFAEQPPLIPHKDSYSITKDKNGCLTCHSWDKAKRMKATPVAKSHVIDDQGTVNGMNYFCVQCHVAQADNKQELVENTFTTK
ncbi:nitrate reductase cytochrome c-type subunit [Shewanella livingstonensis]|uniref:Periplasmic nitrate reductase, electron transfer subunit n=1 Tax=Shewanella livingstonensis TaxID=150120 RepID=A0A3G8LR91_9GAMM|nr:nitrate reductase cytochrome c-type subunit [Shewanella livingstonensis]AZG72051.1 nitrate reductase cytochrome c-type subunit; periplasmic nitrate reductase electron transfer subunit [Shewanella livingstonensis]